MTGFFSLKTLIAYGYCFSTTVRAKHHESAN